MQSRDTSWQQPLFIFLFFAVTAIALIAPIASNTNIANLADFTNHIAAIIQAKMALQQGQFPLRVAPLEQMGWQYPFYQFYSPTSYTIAGLIYWWFTPNNPLLAYKITVWFALVIGGIYMYRLALMFCHSKHASLLASVAYLFSPYYIIVINRLGNLNETIGLALIPIIMFYSMRMYYGAHKTLKLFLIASVTWYVLITTHLITFVYFSLFAGLFFIGMTFKNRQQLSPLLHVIGAYFLGYLLAMWFVLPSYIFAKYFLISSTYLKAGHFTNFSPLLSYLLYPAAAITTGYKNSLLLTLHPAIGWPILAAVAVSLYALATQRVQSKQGLVCLVIIFFIAFIMVWSPIDFWRWLPKTMTIGQYSWRILGQVIWLGALLFAWALVWLFQNKLDLRHTVVGVLLLVVASNVWFPVLENSAFALEKFIKHPLLVYNGNAYNINFNKNTQFVDAIDNIMLYSLMDKQTLQLNATYKITGELLSQTITPVIAVQGSVPANVAPDEQLSAMLDGKTIATLNLKPGIFHWDIPLAKNMATPATFQFKVKRNPNIAIAVARITLGGFVNHANTLDVVQVQKNCKQEKDIITCHLNVPSGVTQLELPTLYYPKLLKISINDQSVNYQSMIYQNYLLATISPVAGMNHIIIHFRGLPLANVISWFTWGFWLILLVVYLTTRFRSR